MTPGSISKKVVGDRLELLERMIGEIRSFTMGSFQEFVNDRRNIWASESCLSRAIEALLDIGRHILAKSFATGVGEYKEIGKKLGEFNVLSTSEAKILRILAGYRNRMIHFYHEIMEEELYRICKDQLEDLERIKDAYIRWLKANPDKINERL